MMPFNGLRQSDTQPDFLAFSSGFRPEQRIVQSKQVVAHADLTSVSIPSLSYLMVFNADGSRLAIGTPLSRAKLNMVVRAWDLMTVNILQS